MAVNSSRKRHLSLPAVGESEVKKIRCDIGNKLSEDHSDNDSGDDENSGSTECNGKEATKGSNRNLHSVVRARRNLLGKKCNEMKTMGKMQIRYKEH